MSYFVGHKAVKDGYSEDAGFAINGGKGWSDVVFENHQIDVTGNVAIAMGNYYFTSASDGSKTKVEYTFGYWAAGFLSTIRGFIAPIETDFFFGGCDIKTQATSATTTAKSASFCTTRRFHFAFPYRRQKCKLCRVPGPMPSNRSRRRILLEAGMGCTCLKSEPFTYEHSETYFGDLAFKQLC